MTNGQNFNKAIHNKKVLIAPLDWGLGHATRCIPIINDLLQKDNQVFIAASGNTQKLLQLEFPKIEFLYLKGYNVNYSKSKFWLPITILIQLPKIFASIKYENSWLKNIAVEKKIDLIISDNRLGFYHSTIPSIYITHQLTIKSSFLILQNWMQKFHYKYINKFSECWVPDYEGENNLAGILSHPKTLPIIPVHYLSPLSRFIVTNEQNNYELLILLSGPEPQRTILEKKLLTQLSDYTKSVLFIRGVFDNTVIKSFNKIHVENNLVGKELNKALLQSKIIIARSGYSTIMDLVKLKKKAILIPTPGQTEQEYLGEYLTEKGVFFSVKQNEFNLKKNLNIADTFFSEL